VRLPRGSADVAAVGAHPAGKWRAAREQIGRKRRAARSEQHRPDVPRDDRPAQLRDRDDRAGVVGGEHLDRLAVARDQRRRSADGQRRDLIARSVAVCAQVPAERR
jgi:hypothetical protein